ncbi:MAG: YkvA family protein [Anaerolineaceae bacterium]
MNWFESIKRKAALIKRDIFALYFAYRDPRLSWVPKLFTACVVAYAFSPIDLIPDFIPVIGYLDDLVIIPAGITIAIRLIPREILLAAREKANLSLLEKKPANWYAGFLIILIWLGVAYLVIDRWGIR